MLGRLGASGAVAATLVLVALNVVVDSVLYFVSVVIDAATVAGAGWLLWRRDRLLKARHGAVLSNREARIASLERELLNNQPVNKAIVREKAAGP